MFHSTLRSRSSSNGDSLAKNSSRFIRFGGMSDDARTVACRAQRNTGVGSARIELTTVCLGGSRTSCVLRAAGGTGGGRDRNRVRTDVLRFAGGSLTPRAYGLVLVTLAYVTDVSLPRVELGRPSFG